VANQRYHGLKGFRGKQLARYRVKNFERWVVLGKEILLFVTVEKI
jgi:hypothetical protein